MGTIGWTLASGERVVDRHHSHVHGAAAYQHLPAALGKICSNGRKFIVEEVDFGRPIGQTICVATRPGDEIVYAQRAHRRGLSRFVKNRTPEVCSCITIILKRDVLEDYYIVVSSFVGYRSEPEPWDRNANGNSLAFWAAHALVWGHEQIIPGTETTQCPW